MKKIKKKLLRIYLLLTSEFIGYKKMIPIKCVIEELENRVVGFEMHPDGRYIVTVHHDPFYLLNIKYLMFTISDEELPISRTFPKDGYGRYVLNKRIGPLFLKSQKRNRKLPYH